MYLTRTRTRTSAVCSTSLREQPFDFYGEGQEDLSEPENFFWPIFRAGEFFRRPFGPDYFFLKTPRALFIKPLGVGGLGGSTSRFVFTRIFFRILLFPINTSFL